MADKETLEQFVKNLPQMSGVIQRVVMQDWGKNTLRAMGKAKYFAPMKKGTLMGSARKVNVKLTNNGLKSAFIFGVPYAYKLEKGVDEKGRHLNIRTDKNANAQSGYAARGVDEQEPFFMSDIKKAISIAWDKV